MAPWSFWSGDPLFVDQYARLAPTATPPDTEAICDRCRIVLSHAAGRVLWRRVTPGVFPPLALLCTTCDGECVTLSALGPAVAPPKRKKR
jgi:hypothetical protein